MRLSILCTGDLHLGRYPTRVPLDERHLSVGHVWLRTVDEAVRRGVDAVVLTGDVADRSNAFFEAFGPLQKGVEELIGAGTQTFAVAGNHDFEVLARLQRALDSPLFKLLGEGERWETAVLERDGVPLARFAGWSFGRQYVDESPMKDFPRSIDASLPLIGMVHADLDAPGSPYGPVARQELFATPVPLWLLGHIHRPWRIEEGGKTILYPGSLQPLDPGEPGVHGPWIVSIDADGSASFEHVPLATVRYQEEHVLVSAARASADVEPLIVQRLTEVLRSHAQDHPELRHLACRLSLTGRTHLHRELARRLADRAHVIEARHGETVATVDRLLLATRPVHDLAHIAEQNHPAGALARVLLALEGDGGTEARAVTAAAGQASKNLLLSGFRPLNESAESMTDEKAVRERIGRQGLLLLDALVAQIEDVDDEVTDEA